MTWSDPARPDRMTIEEVRFLIRFELGQAPASLYVDARSKDRTKRDRALEALTMRIASRFAHLEMLRSGRPFGNHG
ncbi:hypothetical protein SAMN06295912_1597 [Sphingomonas laterariae]|uniref:Uncharacterized protein n=1 Tax=Edaphosphingomonas laterariae TaxID=861865 RepID=A0A239KUG1_9SPHN|nr:hypothetical protein [Sphingomonas laterariae]SNT20874.1 hypothetical protein SAMN06295912_1597 [Sphingomonas laterariae]